MSIPKMQTIVTFPIDYWKARSPEFLSVIHRAAWHSQVSAKHTWPGSWRKPASLSVGRLCRKETTTNCLHNTVQDCPILTTSLPCNNPLTLFPEMGDEKCLPPFHQQTAGWMPKDHTSWSAMPFLINFLIKKNATLAWGMKGVGLEYFMK